MDWFQILVCVFIVLVFFSKIKNWWPWAGTACRILAAFASAECSRLSRAMVAAVEMADRMRPWKDRELKVGAYLLMTID